MPHDSDRFRSRIAEVIMWAGVGIVGAVATVLSTETAAVSACASSVGIATRPGFCSMMSGGSMASATTSASAAAPRRRACPPCHPKTVWGPPVLGKMFGK